MTSFAHPRTASETSAKHTRPPPMAQRRVNQHGGQKANPVWRRLATHTPANRTAQSGTALKPDVRSRIEPVLGANLSHARVHSDHNAQAACHEIQARAFTLQNHIFLGDGEHDTDLPLMAHEATHVVQQGEGRAPGIQRLGITQQPAPTEAGLPYSEKTVEKVFSAEEKIWIHEVLTDPFVQLIFGSYEAAEIGVLHRVKSLDGAKGEYSSASNQLAIADKVYDNKSTYRLNGKSFTETDEQAFKGTLIHEIFHYLENNARSTVKGMPMPRHLQLALIYPQKFGLPRYAFGWFVHPYSNAILHFNVPGVTGIDKDMTILGNEELFAAYKSKTWENSPLSVSGNSISTEEDIAESISLALASEQTREVLKTNYPYRYKLLNTYIRRLQGFQNKASTP